eukprot:COSAG01_NODE_40222_length_466_cov_1.027248_1_plen_50_part_10
MGGIGAYSARCLMFTSHVLRSHIHVEYTFVTRYAQHSRTEVDFVHLARSC